MQFAVRGIKAAILMLVALLLLIVVIALVFQLLIVLIPLILILVLLGYFFRIFRKLKKQPIKKQPDKFIDVPFKVKSKK